MSEPTEVLLVAGVVRRLDGKAPAEALLVRGDRIAHVGSEQECRAAAMSRPRVVDLGGRAVLPGFVDAHCHPLMHGQFGSWVDCGWQSAPRLDDVVLRLQQRARAFPDRAARGHGFHHGNVAEQRMLTRHDLDRVAEAREVVVFHSSGHGAIVNTWTLAAAGVDSNTPDPPGGHFGREADGTPNGEVWDAAADWLTGPGGVKITNHGPNFHLGEDDDLLVAHLAAAQREMHSVGVTSVVDAQVTGRELRTYQRLRAQGGLTMRVEALVLSNLVDQLEALGVAGRLGDDQLAITGVKLYADGALTAATARFSEPYCGNPEDHGYLYHDPSELADLLRRTLALGLQTATHAQGDAAIDMVLDAHAVLRKDRAASESRHRIEHFGGATREQVHRAGRLDLWPVTQPQYLRRYGDEFRRALGDRADRLTPLGEMRDARLPLVLSSDAPVCPPNPLEAVFSAVTRRTLAGDVLGDENQCLTVEEALRAHTSGAAASVHRDAVVGSLRPGHFADLVILSADPLSVAVDELLHIQVLQTWVGGRVVFERGSAVAHEFLPGGHP